MIQSETKGPSGLGDVGERRRFRPLKRLRFASQRLKASARAGTFVLLRRRARFSARAIDQDGVLLLMPREPSLAFYWVPLAILFMASGALLGTFS